MTSLLAAISRPQRSRRSGRSGLRFDFEAAEEIFVGVRQSFIEAAGALALEMRVFAAERDEGLPVVAFAHGTAVSYLVEAEHREGLKTLPYWLRLC